MSNQPSERLDPLSLVDIEDEQEPINEDNLVINEFNISLEEVKH